jgi:outer membrane protein assembly complex protein YaeT
VKRWLVSILVCWAAIARAQPDDALKPMELTPAQCAAIDTTPGAPLGGAPASDVLAMPEPWSDFTVEGKLVEPAATVRALLEPTMAQYRTSLTPKAWVEIGAATAKYGYQLVSHRIDQGKITMRLEPLPLVRTVRVSVDGQGWFDRPLDDDIRRRMRLRTGSLLPWGTNSPARQCALKEETSRILEFLTDEGFYAATASVLDVPDGTHDNLVVKVDLNDEFHIGKTTIVPGPNQLAIPDAEIAAMFKHNNCILGEKHWCVLGPARFTRSRYQQDLGRLKARFHELGYYSVRIQSSVMTDLAAASINRRTRTVDPTLTIDQRRHTFVDFTGPYSKDAISDAQLSKQLTFAEANSADDVEAANSARAIQAYLQTRGYFDARVTWARERLDIFDRVTFTIEPGQHRATKSVEFVGNHAISTDALTSIVAVKASNLAGDLLGTNTNATSELLSTDIDRIVEAYRRAGYREARVSVSASPDPAGLDDPAMTAALVQLGETGGLYVRYTIDEGRPTMLSKIVLEHADKDKQLDPALCDQMMREIASELSLKLARSGCTAIIGKPFREDDVIATRDGLRDFLFKKGRPRAVVDYSTVVTGDHEVAAHYAIRGLDPLRIGKIVIRGNFRTKASVIRAQLAAAKPRFREGAPLSADALAEAARQLRTTTLFSAVNIDLPDLATDSDVVNAIVRVEERYDATAQIELGAGYSSYNGLFGTITTTDNNIGGRGIQLQVQGTLGQKLKDASATLRFPKWLIGQWFDTEVNGRYTQQDTPRFGLLTTEGFTAGITRQWPRQRTATQQPRSIAIGFHYDFRLRSRNIDALRPEGADMDNTQVAVSTRTGALGFTAVWDQRLDRGGQLSPLAAEDGFRLEGSVSIAAPELGGQDTFVKLSAAASKFLPIGKNLTIRGDARYDQGIPLRGAALLPDVERFFAGGDTTVRGYEDDRLATEIIQVGVPPVAGLTQIRVIPAGGNIRVLGSLDAQLRLYKILAGAVFSDAGLITNQWGSVTLDDIRPSVGSGLRVLTPFGILAVEYAVPLRPHLGDDPRGRTHFYFAARAQF